MPGFDPGAINKLIQKHGPKLLTYIDAEECERDLATFFRRSWPNYVAAKYMHNWHVDACADHLMACVDGSIRRLLINLPPRCAKTSLCTIAFPAWVWALNPDPEFPLYGATAEFLCIAYNTIRSQEDAVTSRRLIGSPWYQQRWGDRVKIALDRDNSERFDTVAGGARISTGINATVLGRGGNIKIIDDAMKPDEPESDQVRTSILRSYDETLSNRENDPRIACEIIIAQRLGELDLPGHVLSKYGSDPDCGGFVHLCIPAEYESERHCVTVLGWNDPRGCDAEGEPMSPNLRRLRDGTSFWPKRFPPAVLEQRRTAEGPFSYAAKYQQSPIPRGGGIVKAEWWQLWEDEAFPDFRLVLVSVDTAHTAKEQNDESGVSVWGVFDFGENNSWPQVMLVNAWEGRLEFNRLVEKVADMCKNHNADVCLIEGEANGIDVINEIRRRYGKREWTTVQFDPKGDKASRLLAVQPLFSGEYRVDEKTERGKRGIGDWSKGVVWAPDEDYAQLMIDRIGAFIGGKQKALALVDTTSQALTWLRRNSHLLTKEEHQDDLDEEVAFQKPVQPLYDV